MKEVALSPWICQKKEAAKALLDALLAEFSYASVLLTDSRAKNYRVSRNGISVNESNSFGERGAVVRVYDGQSYAEYATNDVCRARISSVLSALKEKLQPLTKNLPAGLDVKKLGQMPDEKMTLSGATACNQLQFIF